MAVDQDTLQMLRTEPEPPELDLSWLDPGTEWGIRARPGRRGLTLDDINVGAYGDIPEYSTNETMLQRGAARRDGTPRTGWRVHDRGSVWSDNATLLYEEAVQRQWSSATDIPWETLQPLPDELERAMCQLCTFLTEVEFIAGDTPGKWLPRVSNDHYEVKLFLASQIMDEARHLDVFRKRALANGGGLMSGGPGTGLRAIIDSQDFSEMSAIMHLVGEGFIQSLFRSGELISTNEAEKRIFRLAAQDESRHVAFGVMHMKYILATEPWRREELHSYLDIGEGIFAATGVSVNPASMESLAILLGGGIQKIDEGIKMLMAVRRRQVHEYVHRLEVAGLGERAERLSPRMRLFLN